MNMGGPATLKEVHPFLLNLFSDRDLIPLPAPSILAPWIAKRRTPKIEKQYAEIGGGSPILKWTQKQGDLLVKALNKMSPEGEDLFGMFDSCSSFHYQFSPLDIHRSNHAAQFKPYIAFRYAPPLTPETIAEMKKDNITRAVVLSLYPQYSCSTTGSSLNELHKNIKALDPEGSIKWSVIDRYPTHPGVIDVTLLVLDHLVV